MIDQLFFLLPFVLDKFEVFLSGEETQNAHQSELISIDK